ncbi:galactokinase [Planosporangium thailandense]|uniref:Galactokinase n=1 Tax=Planosporangium thailandense TaxID=765197 RepID=A0ABX0Y0V6_9ACTN|nr:galactokinase [Planosporangium thailandense]
MTPAQRASRLFGERFDAAPAAVWAAPGRANLIGEHTDYNAGYVLPFALPQVTAAAVAPADDGWTVCSEGHDGTVSFGPENLSPGGVSDWAAYVAGVVWALNEAGVKVPPARIAIASDVPIGAGLSSSAAMECAVLAALVDLGGATLPAQYQARLAQRAENEFVGAPTGIMDQSAATLSRAGQALFLDCRTLAVEHIPFDVAAAGLAVLVVNTNAPHRHVDGEYADRRAVCEASARTLRVPALRDVSVAGLPDALGRLDEVAARRVRHIVTENQRVLDTVKILRTGDIAAIGPLLTASHDSMRDDFEITVPEVDTAVSAALKAGAYGARMTGGGFGGCVLALVDAADADAVASAVASAFEAAGFAPPDSFVVAPSQGAYRAL